jgi:hypothetical protein
MRDQFENVEIRQIEALQRYRKLCQEATGKVSPLYVSVPLKETIFAVGTDDGRPYMERIDLDDVLDIELIGDTSLVGGRIVVDDAGRISIATVVVDQQGIHWWRAQSVVDCLPLTTAASMIVSRLNTLAQDNRWKPLAKLDSRPSDSITDYVPGLAHRLAAFIGFDDADSVYWRISCPTYVLYSVTPASVSIRVASRRPDQSAPRIAKVVMEDQAMTTLPTRISGQYAPWVRAAMTFAVGERLELERTEAFLRNEGGYNTSGLPPHLVDTNPVRYLPSSSISQFGGHLFSAMAEADLDQGARVYDAIMGYHRAHYTDDEGRLNAVIDLKAAVEATISKRFDAFCEKSGWTFWVNPLDVLKLRLEALIETKKSAE